MLAHSTAGRVRLRLSWLRDLPSDGDRVADGLAVLDGMEEVQVRPYTGSVLCRFDPGRLDEQRILRQAQGLAADGSADDGGSSDNRRLLARAVREGTGVGHAAAALFKGIDADLLSATGGRLDLADSAALGLLALGLTKAATSEELPLPSWFDLLWWAYTVFTREERSAIAHTPHPLTAETRRAR